MCITQQTLINSGRKTLCNQRSTKLRKMDRENDDNNLNELNELPAELRRQNRRRRALDRRCEKMLACADIVSRSTIEEMMDANLSHGDLLQRSQEIKQTYHRACDVAHHKNEVASHMFGMVDHYTRQVNDANGAEISGVTARAESSEHTFKIQIQQCRLKDVHRGSADITKLLDDGKWYCDECAIEQMAQTPSPPPPSRQPTTDAAEVAEENSSLPSSTAPVELLSREARIGMLSLPLPKLMAGADVATDAEPVETAQIVVKAIATAQRSRIDDARYCWCQQIAYGKMVKCNNSRCPHEYFHYECVNITKRPKKGEWYCADCASERLAQMPSMTSPEQPAVVVDGALAEAVVETNTSAPSPIHGEEVGEAVILSSPSISSSPSPIDDASYSSPSRSLPVNVRTAINSRALSAAIVTAILSIETTRYCWCHQKKYGEMVQCANSNCPYTLFHLKCVNLTQLPDGDWFCAYCLARSGPTKV